MDEKIKEKLESIHGSVDIQNDKIDSIADFLQKQIKSINKKLNKLTGIK